MIILILLMVPAVSDCQFRVPAEDCLFASKGVTKLSGFTDGWIYYNENVLLFHFVENKKEKQALYIIKKKTDPEQDSTVVIWCYPLKKNNQNVVSTDSVDFNKPALKVTINYAGKDSEVRDSGPVILRTYTDVDLLFVNTGLTGGFKDSKHSHKEMIPGILNKYSTYFPQFK